MMVRAYKLGIVAIVAIIAGLLGVICWLVIRGLCTPATCIAEIGEFCQVSNERCTPPSPTTKAVVIPQSAKIELEKIAGIQITVNDNSVRVRNRAGRTKIFRILGNVAETGVAAGTIGIPAIFEELYFDSGANLPKWVYYMRDLDNLPDFKTKPLPIQTAYARSMWMYTKDVKPLKIDFGERCDLA